MTGYRDDRAALKKRNEELEEEVAALRAQLKTRGDGGDEPAPLATGLAERPLPWGLVAVGVVAFTAAAWLVAGPIVGTQMVVLAVVASVTAAIVSRLLVVPAPHEATVLSGAADPPFRVLRGIAVRVPLIHATHTLELRARLVTFSVDNAYARGGVPLTVRGYAIVGVDPVEPGIRRAVERFLGTDDVESVAAQTLEGAARQRIAELTPEELSQDRLPAGESLRADAEEDLAKLGLVILDLGIEDVSDSVGYLDQLPRATIAEALRDAEGAKGGTA